MNCFAKNNCAPLNNQNINLAEKNISHNRNALLEDSNPNNERLATQLGLTTSGQLLITKIQDYGKSNSVRH